MNIRSRLILVLLLIGIVSAFATAWIGYRSGSDNLSERIVLQLESLREITSNQIRDLFRFRVTHADTLAGSSDVIDALRGLGVAKDALRGESVPASIGSDLRAWYSEYVLRDFGESGAGARGVPVVEAYLPGSNWGTYLQYHYLAENPADLGDKEELLEASDGSLYSRIHAEHHAALRDVVDTFGYHDLFLIDTDGDVVYTVSKEIDFATNLVDGPHADSGLARAWSAASVAKASGYVHFEDFSFYAPSNFEPALFVATPVFDDGKALGVLALQLSPDGLDDIVNQGGRWEASGLGPSGEIFVVGRDRLLRTTARGFVEDPERYLETVRDNGVDIATIDRMRAQGSTLLLQSASSEAVTEAIRGERDVYRIPRDYSGRPALSASGPLAIPGLDWVIVAEEPVAEAFAPIREFGRRVLIVSAVLSILLTCASLLVARLFTRPLGELVTRAERVSAGEADATMRLARRDEFGELSESMQGMVDRLTGTTVREREAREESERRLSRFVPAIVTEMIEEAESGSDQALHILRRIEGTAVVHARLVGQSGLFRGLEHEGLVEAVDNMVQLFDGAVERTGVEKIRAIGNTYLAVAGLSTRHIDNEERAIDFAIELRATVQRLANESGEPLEICIGIGMGEITAAVVGRIKLSFDVFGGPVNRAHRLSRAARPGEIRVSARLAERLSDRWPFDPVGENPSAGRALSDEAPADDGAPSGSPAGGRAPDVGTGLERA